MATSPALFATARSARTLRLIARRVLQAVPVLLGVTLLTFFLIADLPGNAARQLLGPDASEEQVARMTTRLRLDQTATERYARWLRDTLSGNLGRSLASDQPVADVIAERLPVTLELLCYSIVLSVGACIPLALLAASRPGAFADRLISLFSLMGVSMASYVLALLLVLAFSVHLRWFPSIGFAPPTEGVLQNLRSLTLPALSVSLPLICLYTRFLRGDLLDQMNREDYVITALAKGLSRRRVLIRHAFRNSLFGLLTVAGLHFGTLLGGTVIVEQIFALPGMGQLLLQAINIRDMAVVQGIVLLVAGTVVAANLLVDLLYQFLDPRLRHGT